MTVLACYVKMGVPVMTRSMIIPACVQWGGMAATVKQVIIFICITSYTIFNFNTSL